MSKKSDHERWIKHKIPSKCRHEKFKTLKKINRKVLFAQCRGCGFVVRDSLNHSIYT